MKLVVREPESEALYTILDDWPWRSSSIVARLEVSRALRGAAAPLESFERWRELLRRLARVPISAQLLDAAAVLDPPDLRSLDALHLVSALELGGALGAFVTYDRRLFLAARHTGVLTLAPGAEDRMG